MGKIADALERRKKEKSLSVELLTAARHQKTVSEGGEMSLAKEFCTLHECSPKVVGLSSPESIEAECFRNLRAQILFARDRETPRSILVSSPFPGDGKTTVAVNLAVSLAMGMDNRVLLVDCDLRKPQVHEMLGYPNSGGLNEYFRGKKQLEDLIIRTQLENLSFLPAGDKPANPAELLSSSTMKEFIKEVKARCHDGFVIIDSAPAHGTADATVLANHVDGIVLVVLALRSPREAIQKTIRDMGEDKILGVVFNGYNKALENGYKYYKGYYRPK